MFLKTKSCFAALLYIFSEGNNLAPLSTWGMFGCCPLAAKFWRRNRPPNIGRTGAEKNELHTGIGARASQILVVIQMMGLPMVNGQYLAWPLRALIQTRS